jgi:hypothetical protein
MLGLPFGSLWLSSHHCPVQLIPAAILFFSFIGTATAIVFKGEKKAEEEVMLPATEAVPIKK